MACGLSLGGAAERRNGSLEKGLVTPQRTVACEAESAQPDQGGANRTETAHHQHVDRSFESSIQALSVTNAWLGADERGF